MSKVPQVPHRSKSRNGAATLTVKEVATLLKRKPRSIRKALHLGQLRGTKLLGHWVVSRSQVEAILTHVAKTVGEE